MLLQRATLAALAGSALLAAAPAFADNYRGERHEFRGGYSLHRPVYAQDYGPRYYGQRPVFVHRPVVVYREHSSHDVLGGLILGAVLGAVIANHAGY